MTDVGLPAGGTPSTLRYKNKGVQQETTGVHGKLSGLTEWRVVMDYEKMKAFMEAGKESSAQRRPQVKEFPKPDSRPDWKYLDYVQKHRMAA